MILDLYKLVDLTHLLNPSIPNWDNQPGFNLETKSNYENGFRTEKIHTLAGIGTHMDAPCHMIKGGPSISDFPLELLMIPACLLDISNKNNPDYRISAEDIAVYEKEHGQIPKNSFFIAYTGWSRFWPDPVRYRNPDSKGSLHFPTFSVEAAELLIEREIAGIGTDTLSPDIDPSYPIHNLMLKNGKFIVENLANCHLLPPKGAEVILLPLNIHEASESPIRAVGLIKKG